MQKSKKKTLTIHDNIINIFLNKKKAYNSHILIKKVIIPINILNL